MRVPAAVVFVCLAGCATSPRDEPTVEAVRFRQFIAEGGAMDFIHGGGQWFDCLYLPNDGIIAQVVWERGDLLSSHARLYAYRGTITPPPHRAEQSLEAKRPHEAIRIPASIAARIVAMADLEVRRRTEGMELGASCVASGLVGGVDSVGKRDF